MLHESRAGALDSSSATESGHTSVGDSLPDQSQPSKRPDDPQKKLSLLRRRRRDFDVDDEEDGDGDGDEDDGDARGEEFEEEKGSKLWEAFNNNFREVQTMLEQNRVLIQQVNENHRSKIPDNLTKNVALIREINGNISKVVSLYSHLGAHFSDVFDQRRAASHNNSNSA